MTQDAVNRPFARNVERYKWLQFSSSLLAWLPIFFLYFNQFVSLAQVIQLGALYYLAVCVFEVPSGYFSDRFGRRNTLLIAAGAFVASYGLFLSATTFSGFALAQLFIALAIAMQSGTDTAFLYDSLLCLKREDEYAQHEATGQKYGFTALTLASLAGGLLGLIDLRLAYVLSLLGALWMGYLVWQCAEPQSRRTSQDEGKGEGHSFSASLKQCALHLKTPILAWIFGVVALRYCLEHVTYEFYQPYIKLLDIKWLLGADAAPLISGVVIAISMFGGVLGAAYSVRLNDKLGLKALLFVAVGIQMLIISSLATALSAWLITLVMLRNFPMAMSRAPINATIAPHIDSSIRATYLSLQSLSARLFFSLLLYLLSMLLAPDQALDWPSLQDVLSGALIFGLVGIAIMGLFARVARD